MTLNAYAHLSVRNVPGTVLDDDELVEAIWRELPDACLATAGGPLEITVSQLAITDRQIAHRQSQRVANALAAAGVPDAEVQVDEIERFGVRDDVQFVVGFVLWQVCRLLERLTGRRER